ncbi:MAG: hypothetical protein COA42_21510 [Alteromonadaceae bacterium]|nr:MAG: hypothetical protein COA42_21510 [Alteromonadaceae bacterium]
MSVKVQIYIGAGNHRDALMCARAGADFIGFAADQTLINDVDYTGGTLPTLDQIGEIFQSLPTSVSKVALSFSTDPEEVAAMIEKVKPDIVHLAGKNKIAISDIAHIKHDGGHRVKILQAIAVNLPDAIDTAQSYSRVCDYYLLDSKGDDSDHPYGIGATGEAHDWKISAELVKRVNIPIILAGGLHQHNVAEAIRVVKPWGVDSFTLTNIEPTQASRKDPNKVAAFINAARPK